MPHQHSVCIIDDDTSLRAAMTSFVRSLGHRVECFASSEAFLASGDSARFSCIISDIDLPGMSGIELQAALARRGSGVPVVLMTGRDGEGVPDRAPGALRLLAKPCTARAIIECLDAAFGR